MADAAADLANLLAKLEDADDKVRLSAVLALARRVEFREAAADPLVALVEKERHRLVRFVAAVYALGRSLGDKRAIPHVIAYLSDGDPEYRATAAKTLAIPGLLDFTVDRCLRNLSIETLLQVEKAELARPFRMGTANAVAMATARAELMALGLYTAGLEPADCAHVAPERGGALPSGGGPLVPFPTPTDPDPTRHNGGAPRASGGGPSIALVLLAIGAVGGTALYLMRK